MFCDCNGRYENCSIPYWLASSLDRFVDLFGTEVLLLRVWDMGLVGAVQNPFQRSSIHHRLKTADLTKRFIVSLSHKQVCKVTHSEASTWNSIYIYIYIYKYSHTLCQNQQTNQKKQVGAYSFFLNRTLLCGLSLLL